jgi:hypothetical protein
LNFIGLTVVFRSNDLPVIAYSSRTAIPQKVVRNAVCRLHYDTTATSRRSRIVGRKGSYDNRVSMKEDGEAAEPTLVDSKQIRLYVQRRLRFYLTQIAPNKPAQFANGLRPGGRPVFLVLHLFETVQKFHKRTPDI